MKKYKVLFAKQAMKDVKSLSPKLKKKLQDILLEVILEDPFCGKKVVGDLKGRLYQAGKNTLWRLIIGRFTLLSVPPNIP